MTGILFNARLGSTRLEQKHLIEVQQKTFIEWLVSRFAHEFKKEIVSKEVFLILATSEPAENRKFERILHKLPVSIFYGNDENIPMRQVECSKEYDLQKIISIDGDDILCSASAARQLFRELSRSDRTWVKTSGLPFGMNSMGYTSAFLEDAVGGNADKLETGWGRIFEGRQVTDIHISGYPEDNKLRLTLDYQLDAEFFKQVISFFGEKTISVSDEELIQIVIEKRFYEINASLHEEYWNNFNKKKKSEEQIAPDEK